MKSTSTREVDMFDANNIIQPSRFVSRLARHHCSLCSCTHLLVMDLAGQMVPTRAYGGVNWFFIVAIVPLTCLCQVRMQATDVAYRALMEV